MQSNWKVVFKRQRRLGSHPLVWLCVVVLLMGVSTEAQAAKKWKPRIRPKGGSSKQLELRTDLNVTAKVPLLGTQTGRLALAVDATQAVTAREKRGPTNMTLHYDRLRFDLDFRDTSMRYDTAEEKSEAGDAASIGAQLERLRGQPLTYVVSQRGQISDVGGLDVAEGVVEADGRSGDSIADSIRESLGPRAIETLLQLAHPVFPDQKVVRVGDQWNHELRLEDPSVGAMGLDSRYEMLGIERKHGRKCVKLAVIQRIDLAGDGGLLNELGDLVNAKGDVSLETESAKGIGYIWIERKTGLVAGLELQQRIKAKLSVPVSVLGFTRRVSIPVTLEQQISGAAP